MAHTFKGTKRNASTATPLAVVEIAPVRNPELVERRKFIRPVPAAQAVECHDEASWSTWNELAALHDQQAESASALAKLQQPHTPAGRGGN